MLTHQSLEYIHSFPPRVLDLRASLYPSIALVDTRDQDANRSISQNKYGTLSHCWGLIHVIATRKEILEGYKEKIKWSDLPRTFRDAIRVFRELRIRYICYIWIDSLCIVQNDSDDWNNEAVPIVDIYANSYLNIAATAAKDSTIDCLSDRKIKYGLGDVPISSFEIVEGDHSISKVPVRPSFEPVHRRFTTNGERQYDPPIISNIDAIPLLSRAWVYQERMLACRTPRFHPPEMILECKSGLSCECKGHRAYIDLMPDNAVLERWLHIVKEYSAPALTKQEDLPLPLGYPSTNS